jgi:hypothetical protein
VHEVGPEVLDDIEAAMYDVSEDNRFWEPLPEPLSEPKQVINERDNVEQRIRTAAQKIMRPDNSGHGSGKTIPKGVKGDKHEKGQRRKDTRKKALSNNLEDLLEHYAELGGDETTLEPSTKKLLRKAGWAIPTLKDTE